MGKGGELPYGTTQTPGTSPEIMESKHDTTSGTNIIDWLFCIFAERICGRRQRLDYFPNAHQTTSNGAAMLTLKATNIQVRAKWRLDGDYPFAITDNGELQLTATLSDPATIVATVIVEDMFSELNSDYQNLAATALITVEFMFGTLRIVNPPARLLAAFGMGGAMALKTSGGMGERIFRLYSASDYFTLGETSGILSVAASVAVGQYAMTVEVRDETATLLITVIAEVEAADNLILANAPPLAVTVIAGVALSLHTFTASGGLGILTYALIGNHAGHFYALIDNHAGHFSIDERDGVLRIHGDRRGGVYTLSVEVSDGAIIPQRATAVATITVVETLFLADTPPLTATATEGAVVVLHTFMASGGLGAKTYALIASNAGYFSIDDNSGVLQMNDNAAAGIYTLLVEVTDGAIIPQKATAVATVAVEELLYYEVFGNTDKNHSTMVIYLSGDTGRDKLDSRYLFDDANDVAMGHNVIAAAILRPGTHDNRGNESPGHQPGSDDNKTPANNALVARTILYLKEKYGVENVIGVGHSGGGIMLGVIIGRYPGLIDSVILAGSVCHVTEARIERRERYPGKPLWPNSQSPHDFVESVPKNTMIRIVTGENDDVTLPKYAKKCEALYKEHGLDAHATIVAGGTHSFRTLRSTVNKKLKDIFAKTLFLADTPPLTATEGAVVVLHTFMASGGLGAKTYALIAGNAGYFSIDDNSGVLQMNDNAAAGIYTLLVEVRDGAIIPQKATAVATVVAIEKGELLYYEVFGNTDKNQMVIYLSGDTGRDKLDSRYLFDDANDVAMRHNVIAAAILRPGTHDDYGNESPGHQPRSDDNKTPANNALVARTILYLKEKYGVENVIGVGHSGGGMMLGVIIGRYPGLIDSVILGGQCLPCGRLQN